MGLCLTSGVDSFHSLLPEPGRIGTWAYVHGYDVALEALDCGRCEKCVRTRLVLSQDGMLDRFEVFADAPPLDEAVQDLPALDPMFWPVYRASLDREIAPYGVGISQGRAPR